MDFLKDSSGAYSFGRVGSLIGLLFALTWVTFVVYKKESIPDLGGVSLFIGTLYGLSKAGDTIAAIKGGSNANPPAQ